MEIHGSAAHFQQFLPGTMLVGMMLSRFVEKMFGLEMVTVRLLAQERRLGAFEASRSPLDPAPSQGLEVPERPDIAARRGGATGGRATVALCRTGSAGRRDRSRIGAAGGRAADGPDRAKLAQPAGTRVYPRSSEVAYLREKDGREAFRDRGDLITLPPGQERDAMCSGLLLAAE